MLWCPWTETASLVPVDLSRLCPGSPFRPSMPPCPCCLYALCCCMPPCPSLIPPVPKSLPCPLKVDPKWLLLYIKVCLCQSGRK